MLEGVPGFYSPVASKVFVQVLNYQQGLPAKLSRQEPFDLYAGRYLSSPFFSSFNETELMQ